jgi:pyruvate/2-oxoglutarate/acetoin dehydrogenase E1 component
MTYKDELTKAMDLLAENEKVLFLGQAVSYPGSGMYQTLENIASSKRIEVPIMEDTQMGMSIGLSLQGYIPVSVFPRFDFLICATNQLVNHLDKIGEMSDYEFKPKVIVRTSLGATTPLYPGLQHCSDYTDAFKTFLKNTDVITLRKKEEIVPAYKKALESDRSSLLIEISDLYNKD